jgi:hypothetical protein
MLCRSEEKVKAEYDSDQLTASLSGYVFPVICLRAEIMIIISIFNHLDDRSR